MTLVTSAQVLTSQNCAPFHDRRHISNRLVVLYTARCKLLGGASGHIMNGGPPGRGQAVKGGIPMQFPVLGSQHGRWSYKWTVVLVVVFGSFMSILDQTVINNAIPHLQR